jgi:hypothetical protein
MGPLELLVIYQSVRKEPQGIKAARFVLSKCAGRGHRATLVDPDQEKLAMRQRTLHWPFILLALIAIGPAIAALAGEDARERRLVLVELFTSQG